VAAGQGPRSASDALADLGMEFDRQMFEIVNTDGTPIYRSPRLTGRLPVSPRVRGRARHGEATFETIALGRERARLVTLPLVRSAIPSLLQVAVPLVRTDRPLAHYLETLGSSFRSHSGWPPRVARSWPERPWHRSMKCPGRRAGSKRKISVAGSSCGERPTISTGSPKL
jgi:hypothetical protein